MRFRQQLLYAFDPQITALLHPELQPPRELEEQMRQVADQLDCSALLETYWEEKTVPNHGGEIVALMCGELALNQPMSPEKEAFAIKMAAAAHSVEFSRQPEGLDRHKREKSAKSQSWRKHLFGKAKGVAEQRLGAPLKTIPSYELQGRLPGGDTPTIYTSTAIKIPYFLPPEPASDGPVNALENVENTLDYLINHPSALTDPIMQRRLFQVLTRSAVLQAHIRNHPDYYLSKLPLLQQLHQKFIDEGKIEQQVALLKITSLLAVQVEQAQLPFGETEDPLYPQLDPEMAARILAITPQVYDQEVLEGLRQRAQAVQAELGALLFFCLSIHPNPQIDLGMRSGYPLKLASLMVVQREALSTPLLADLGLQWLQGQIESADLAKWTGVPGDWQPSEANPSIWVHGEAPEESIVDLSKMMIMKINGQAYEGVEATLPKAITESTEYLSLFASKTLQSIYLRPTEEAGVYLYTFEDQQHTKYRAEFNVHTRKLHFERETEEGWLRHIPIEGVAKQGKGLSWKERIVMRAQGLTQPEGIMREQPHGIEQRLAEEGVWIDPIKKRTGRAYVGNQTLLIELNRAGKLQEVRTDDGLIVVHDPQEQLHAAFGPLQSDQVLYLRKKGYKEICQIRFPDDPDRLCITRESKRSPWRVESDRLVVGEERGQAANDLLRSLGVNFEQYGFSVRGDRYTDLILWPRSINQRHRISAAPMRIRVKDSGKVQASCGGFMMLAYLAAAKHDYLNAQRFIDEAIKSRRASLEEIEMLEQMQAYFLDLPTTSVRSATINLKGILALRRIISEQGDAPPRFSLEQAEAIGAKLITYHQLLERSVIESDSVERRRADLTEILLSAQEIEQLKQIGQQGFSFMIQAVSRVERLAGLGEHLPTPALPTSRPEELKLIADLALFEMKKPSQAPLTPLSLDRDLIIGRFFELWEAIRKKEIGQEELTVLASPLPNLLGVGDLPQEVQQGIDSGKLDQLMPKLVELSLKSGKGLDQARESLAILQLHLARTALATLAAKVAADEDEPVPAMNLDQLHKLHQKIPGESAFPLPTLRIGAAIGYYAWKERRGQTEGYAEIKTGLKALSESVVQIAGDQLTAFGEPTPIIESGAIELFMKFTGIQRGVDLTKFAAFLDTPEALEIFGSQVKISLLKYGLSQIPEEITRLQAQGGGLVPLNQLLKIVQEKVGIDLISPVRKGVLRASLHKAAQAAPARQASHLPVQQQIGLKGLFKPLKMQFSRPIEVIEARKGNLKRLADSLAGEMKQKSAAPERMQPFIQSNRAAMQAGIETAHADLTAQTEMLRSLGDPEALRELLLLREKQIRELAKERFTGILETAKRIGVSNTLPQEVCKILANPKVYSSQQLYRALRKANLEGKLSEHPELIQQITEYQLLKISKQALKGVRKRQVSQLLALDRETDQDQWVSLSTQAYQSIEAALNFERYDGLDGAFYRKVLALEESNGWVCRKEQLEMAQELADNPQLFKELPVGMGKTSVVLPLALMMLAEAGKFPVAVVPDALLAQNLDSLDEATRALIARAGVEFHFSINKPCSAVLLLEELLRLRKVRRRLGYPITTVSSLAAIKQKQRMIEREIGELFEKLEPFKALLPSNFALKDIHDLPQQIQEDPSQYLELFKVINELDELIEQQHLLDLIDQELDVRLIDEVDSGQDINTDYIVALDRDGTFTRMIPNVCKELLEHIYTSPALQGLKEAITTNKQIGISPEQLKTDYYPEIVRAFYPDAHPDFVAYLCGTIEGGAPPLPQGDQEPGRCAVLKNLLQGSLTNALAQNPGVDRAVKSSDGFQVGPLVGGREVKGMVFGKEVEIMINNLLSYIHHLPDTPAVRKAIAEELERGNQMLAGVPVIGNPIPFLNEPGNWRLRAVVNQGFNTEGEGAEETVLAMREKAPDKTFVFIDSHTRNYRICYRDGRLEDISKSKLNRWMIDDAEYRADHPDWDYKKDIVFYFHTPDIRGTDIRLPGGEAVALIAAKCSRDALVQLEGRMRSLGATQRISTLLVDDAISQRKVDMSYAAIVRDVEEQSATIQANKHLKVGREGLTLAAQMGIHALLYGSTEVMKTAEYWHDFALPIRLIDHKVRTLLLKNKTIYEEMFRQNQSEAEMQGWLQATRESDRLEYFQQVYRAQLAKIEALKAELRPILTSQIQGIPAGLALQLVPMLRKRVEETQATLAMIKARLEARMRLLEAKCASGPDEREVFAQTALGDASLPASGSIVQEVEQQQQQQQQQEQEQQQQQEQQVVQGDAPNLRFPEVPIAPFLHTRADLVLPDKAPEPIKELWRKAGIELSSNFANAFEVLEKGVQGRRDLARIRITSEGEVCLIAKTDYNQGSHVMLSERPWVGVYQLVNTALYPEGTSPYRVNRQQGEPPPDAHKNPKLLLARFFLGMSDFTEEEIAQLKGYIADRGITLEELRLHAEQYGEPAQVAFVEGLDR